MVLIFHFKCTLKCRLQFLSIWTSLKFCRLVMGSNKETIVKMAICNCIIGKKAMLTSPSRAKCSVCLVFYAVSTAFQFIDGNCIIGKKAMLTSPSRAKCSVCLGFYALSTTFQFIDGNSSQIYVSWTILTIT